VRWVFLLLAFTGEMASGQLALTLEIGRADHLRYEEVAATVTVSNRSGQDLVMAGPGGRSWLTFSMTGPDGNLLPAAGESGVENRVLAAGDTHRERIDLVALFDLSRLGNHGVVASVFHSPSGQFYQSNRVRIQIVEGTELQTWVAGVPLGQPGGGGQRAYSLISYREKEGRGLYVRVRDPVAGRVYATYLLGPLLSLTEPQAAVDGRGHFHVLYLSTPRMFAHKIVAPDGTLVATDFHQSGGAVSRPTLMQNDSGDLIVRGGRLHEPGGGSPGQPAERPGMRMLSDRPAGF
jgi:hypothetical protein